MNTRALTRFLEYLGLSPEPPTLHFLQKIVKVHLEKVPYESVSKILSASRGENDLVTLENYVAGMWDFGFGGTCFANNIYLSELFNFLGFRSEISAVNSQESTHSHVSCKVFVENNRYVVDVGTMSDFAGPFLLAPGETVDGERGENRTVFIPGKDSETYVLEFYRRGQLIRKHSGEAEPKEPTDFTLQIKDSFLPTAYFMQIFCICKHVGDTTLGVWNKSFFKHHGATTETRQLESIADLKKVLAEELRLPNIPVDEILKRMKAYSNVSIF